MSYFFRIKITTLQKLINLKKDDIITYLSFFIFNDWHYMWKCKKLKFYYNTEEEFDNNEKIDLEKLLAKLEAVEAELEEGIIPEYQYNGQYLTEKRIKKSLTRLKNNGLISIDNEKNLIILNEVISSYLLCKESFVCAHFFITGEDIKKIEKNLCNSSIKIIIYLMINLEWSDYNENLFKFNLKLKKDIADKVRISISTINKSLNELINFNLIKKIRRGLYQLNTSLFWKGSLEDWGKYDNVSKNLAKELQK